MEVAAPLVVDCLGRVWVLMFTTAGPTCLGNLHKLVWGDRRVDHLERRGVGAIALLFLSANSVGGKGTGHNGHRKGGKQDECRSETARAQPFEERFHGFHDLVRRPVR